MTVSKAQQASVNKYVKNNYDRINVTMPKGHREIIQAHAEAQGESTNAFINRAIAETMERDNVQQRPQEAQTAPAVQDTTQAQQGVQERPIEGIPLHTLEQRIRRTLYRYNGTIRKDRKSGGYTVVYEDKTLTFPDFAALLDYAQSMEQGRK